MLYIPEKKAVYFFYATASPNMIVMNNFSDVFSRRNFFAN